MPQDRSSLLSIFFVILAVVMIVALGASQARSAERDPVVIPLGLSLERCRHLLPTAEPGGDTRYRVLTTVEPGVRVQQVRCWEGVVVAVTTSTRLDAAAWPAQFQELRARLGDPEEMQPANNGHQWTWTTPESGTATTVVEHPVEDGMVLFTIVEMDLTRLPLALAYEAQMGDSSG